jgi:hypothetical protein
MKIIPLKINSTIRKFIVSRAGLLGGALEALRTKEKRRSEMQTLKSFALRNLGSVGAS